MSSAMSLVDQAARIRAITETGLSCFVEAGAGSGKTRCLVERVLTLLEAGTPAESIAVITFTRKAAGELRDRIRMTVTERLHTDPWNETLIAASTTLDQMAVETIHSFCRRLLLRFSLEAGLPAGLTVMNSVDEQAAQEGDACEFATSVGPDVREAMLELLRAGITTARLSELYKTCWYQPSDLPVPAPFQEAAVRVWFEDLQRLSEQYADLRTDKYVQRVIQFVTEVRRNLDGATTATTFRRMPPWPSRSFGARSGRVVQLKSDMLQMKHRWLQDVWRAWAAQHLQVVASAMAEHAQAAHARRRDGGVLRQDELLRLTMDLLCHQPALRERVRSTCRYLLVDEFQDTDREQVEIIARIVSRPDADSGMTPMLPDPEPGRLFVVGDYRQAIYGFRGADVTLFEAVRDQMPDDVVRLVTNFRSSWPVVHAVNTLFEALDKVHFPPMAAIHSPDTVTDGGAAAFGGPLEAKAAEVRRREARAVVQLVCSELGAGCRPEDIAVLMRNRSILRALESEMDEAGIAYRVESQSLLCATQEYQDVRNLLAAIAFPGDEAAVVAALMGPACGCTLRELQTWRRGGGVWSLQAEPADIPPERVAHSLRRLRDWRALSHQISAPALVVQLISRSGLVESAAAYAHARESWRRYKLLQQMAQDWDGSGGLMGFVRWLDDLADRQIRQDESVTPDLGMPAVRLLTVHAAKGLEFDTVVVAGFAGQGGNTRYPLLARQGSTSAWCPGVCRTQKNEGCEGCEGRSVHLAQREAAQAESMRLLYVACTRAQRRLYLSFWSPSAKAGEPELMERVASAWQNAGLCVVEPQEPSQPRREAPPPPPDEVTLSDWQRQRHAAFQDGRLTIVTPSRLSHADWPLDDAGSPEWEPTIQAADEVRLTPDQRRALQRGHAVHRTLATVSLPDGGDLEVRAIAAARDAGLGDDPETLRLASILLRGVRDLCRHASWKREVYLGLPLGKQRLLEGYADLVIDRPEGLIIVDYKTDFLASEAEVRRRAQSYRPQLACYAHALHEVTGRPVICGYVVFVLNGEPLCIRLDDLEQTWNALAASGFTEPRSGTDSP